MWWAKPAPLVEIVFTDLSKSGVGGRLPALPLSVPGSGSPVVEESAYIEQDQRTTCLLILVRLPPAFFS